MCTILLQSETLSAEKRSRKDSQAEVDKLMEYDRKLSEPFTREELQKIFNKEPMEISSISKSFSSLLSAELYADYLLLTDSEKEIVDDLGLTSDMVEGLFPQMWANCGIFVEQSQSFHRFSARWKNCCKRGNLSTKRPSLQTVEQVNGTGRWIALRGAALPLALSAPHCRTRWFASTA